MADGDALILDSSQAGGSGTIAGETKFKFASAVAATWPVADTRFYAVDTAAGNDANVGFSDVSAAGAFAVAKKTWAALVAIIPPAGAGRNVWIGVKVGTYAESFNLRGLVGYNNLQVVASTDGSDSATDQILSGFVTSSAGPGGAGEWTVAAAPAPTVSVFSVAAGALPAEPTAVLKRVRFTGNVTAALANICTAVHSNTGTVVTVAEDLPVAPAAGDTFFIEEPGAVFNTITFFSINVKTMRVRGLRTAGAWVSDVNFCDEETYTGCEGAASTFINHAALGHNRTYTTIGGTAVRVGTGFRASAALTVQNLAQLIIGNCSGALSTTTFQNCGYGTYGAGCRWTGVVFLTIVGKLAPLSSGSLIWGRAVAGFQDCRHGGNLVVINSSTTLQNLNITTVGGNAIRVFGIKNVLYLSGGTLGAGSACEMVNTFESLVMVDTANVPTLGQFTLAGAVVALTGDAILSAIKDVSNNVVWGVNAAAPTRSQVTIDSMMVQNTSGAGVTPGQIVRITGGTGANGIATVTPAQADTGPHATGGLLAMLTTTANNAPGYAVPLELAAWVKVDAAVAGGELLYLSVITAGNATVTVPPLAATNQKRRLGFASFPDTANVRTKTINGPEMLPVLADGLP